MPSANAIGTGALILSANADGLVSGLDRADKAATGWAKGLDRKLDAAAGGKAGGGGQGPVARLMSAGLNAGLFALIVKGPELAKKAFEEIEKRAGGPAAGAVMQLRGAFERLREGGLALLQKVLVAAAPAILTVADAVLRFFDRMEPYIDGFLEGFEAFAFVGAEAFSVIVDGIAYVVDGVAEFLGSIFGISSAAGAMGGVVLAVLRNVGKGFAYVWDTVKAGAGVIAIPVGLIIEGFGMVIKVIGDAIKHLDTLAQTLPKSIRPGWVGKAADAVRGWGDEIDKAGVKVRQWGVNSVFAWGDSARQVDRWFDGVADRLAERKRQFEEMGADATAEKLSVKFSGAFDRGSKDAYSVIVRNQFANPNGQMQIDRQQLDQQKKTNGLLQKQLDESKKAPRLRPSR